MNDGHGGVIHNVCSASADYCYKLQTRAIGQEIQTRQARTRPLSRFAEHIKREQEREAEIQHELRLREIRSGHYSAPPVVLPENEAPELQLGVEPEKKSAADDPVAEERKSALNRFKRRGMENGIKVTDEMVARAAKESWNTRTMVTWWKRNDRKSQPAHDRLIRAVLSKDPKSIWKPA